MQVELYVALMGGFVLGFFIIVAEVAFFRKKAQRLYAHFQDMHRTGRHARLIAESCGIAAFFLVQPAVVALLVALALGQVNSNFPAYALQQLRRVVAGIF